MHMNIELVILFSWHIEEVTTTDFRNTRKRNIIRLFHPGFRKGNQRILESFILYLFSFDNDCQELDNLVARRFLMSPIQLHWKWITGRITSQKFPISYWQTAGHSKNHETVGTLCSSVSRSLSAIRRCFVVSWKSVKHGFTGTHQKPMNCRNSGLHLRTFYKEGEDCSMEWKDHGHRFLEFARCDPHRLSWEWQNGQKTWLFWIIRWIRHQLVENISTLRKEKGALPPQQYIESRIFFRHCQIDQIKPRTAIQSTVFCKLGSLRLYVSRHQKGIRRSVIWIQLGDCSRYEALLWKPSENVFQTC